MIDTVEKTYKNEDYNAHIGESLAVLDWKVTRNKDFVTVVYRPSKVLWDGSKPSNIAESLRVISDVERCYGMENKGYISRADIAIDLKRTLGEYSKTFRLFIECMRYSMNLSDRPLFETTFNKFEIGNFKISNRSKCLTIYNSSDKNRLGNTRIERRFFSRAVQKSDKEALVEMTQKFMDEITRAESFIEKVEEDYFAALMQRKVQTAGCYSSLAEFFCREDRIFLTANIFKKVYIASGYKDDPSKYLYDYKQRRPEGLAFVNKKDFTIFINILAKVLKDDLDLSTSFFRKQSEYPSNYTKMIKLPLLSVCKGFSLNFTLPLSFNCA